MSTTQSVVTDATAQHSDAPERTREWAKQTAQEILSELRYDHRFCANCFRRIKTTEPPKPDWAWGYNRPHDQEITADAACGFQYPTEHTITDAIGFREASPESINPRGHTFETWGCECGMVHHAADIHPVKPFRAKSYARNLSDTIDDLREEYKTASSKRKYDRVEAWRHSRDRLAHAAEHLSAQPECQGEDTPIFAAALAVALQHPDDH